MHRIVFKKLESTAFWQMNVQIVQTKNNLRYVDGKLEDHTKFISLYAQDSINADSLVASIKDVLC